MCTRSKVLGGMAGVIILVMAAVIVYLVVKVDPCPSCGTTPAPTPPPAPTHAPVTGPRVTLQQGVLEGVWRTTRGNISGNTQYAAFFGIPYAQAPVGPLRFKAPRPHPGWPGVRPAKEPASKCAQGNSGVLAGSEDCLYLNVFTTNHMERDPSKRYPVYVFIHGGAFLDGFPDPESFGPDYLLPHDVILVTPQYRLNSFGFLSLDTEEIPGNSGVKDAVAALQWIYSNIASFGGDPNRITVGGQSAGSVMAGWLTLLPELSGRIQRATLMSGTALHNWAYKESHVATALKVASSLAKQTVTDIMIAEQILMKASTADLFLHGNTVVNQEMESKPELPFAPTPERRTPMLGGEPRIITKDAESYFLDPVAPVIPHLISSTNAEWRFFYFWKNPQSNPRIDEEILQNLTAYVPKDLLPCQDTRQFLGLPESDVDYNMIIDEVRKGIRAAVTPTCDLGCTLKTYFDGIFIITDTHRLAMFRAKQNKAETYLFKFGVRTEMNTPLEVSNPADAKDVAMHSDDLSYIFARASDVDAVHSPEADLTIRRMSAMWANYIKYGKPIERPDELLSVAWPPNTSSNNGVTYLELKADGPILQQAGDYSGPMIQFWQDLYQKYRSKTPPPVPFAQRSVRTSRSERGL